MIRYDILCEAEHRFDGWFASSDSFDEQVARQLVQCPVCGSHKVAKALMTPGVPARGNRKDEPVPALHAPTDPKAQAMAEMVRKLRSHVEENADYVGDKFAEQARRIHYGEDEQRGIYGEATIDEARELHDEGVEVLPLPKLPEDGN
ncbi:DUF1178 family protein [Anderseniella sp. Alg231-50]|uniref:DUF1178 family protein n=1 Tax=Anderseniella sp. Alg231-50 TaxID=1922226 RepID=UPI000D55090D